MNASTHMRAGNSLANWLKWYEWESFSPLAKWCERHRVCKPLHIEHLRALNADSERFRAIGRLRIAALWASRIGDAGLNVRWREIRGILATRNTRGTFISVICMTCHRQLVDNPPHQLGSWCSSPIDLQRGFARIQWIQRRFAAGFNQNFEKRKTNWLANCQKSRLD